MAKRKFNAICENDTRELRQELKLPLTKELVYYDVTDKFKKYKIKSYEIAEELPSFKIINIILETGKEVKIHNAFLSDMQTPSFVPEYIQSAENLENSYLNLNEDIVFNL